MASFFITMPSTNQPIRYGWYKSRILVGTFPSSNSLSCQVSVHPSSMVNYKGESRVGLDAVTILCFLMSNFFLEFLRF